MLHPQKGLVFALIGMHLVFQVAPVELLLLRSNYTLRDPVLIVARLSGSMCDDWKIDW